MEVGRKVYYELATGNVVNPPLETRSGSVVTTTKEQDFAYYSFLKSLNPALYDFVQLAYMEREAEIQNMGSMKINPVSKVLTIYPRLIIVTDKVQIMANGTDTATIKVTVQDTVNPHVISFKVNSGAPVNVNTVNGIATLPITTTVIGDYIVTATSDIYGIGSVSIKGV